MNNRIKALEDALRPFAEYFRGPDGLADTDNLGRQMPDDQGVGWVYLTYKDFRSARAALASSQPAQPVAVKVKALEWARHHLGCFTIKSTKSADNGCDVVYHAERANPSGHVVSTVTKPGYFRCKIENRIGANSEFGSIEAAKAAAQADYEARILASLDAQPLTVQDAARVPEIAALIEKSEALRDDVTGRVDAFGERIGTAQPMIGFGSKQWADFITALRTITEGR